MALINKKAKFFDEEDVKTLNSMLIKFVDFNRDFQFPDETIDYYTYLPVLILALLASQKKLERLTLAITILAIISAIIAVFTIITQLYDLFWRC